MRRTASCTACWRGSARSRSWKLELAEQNRNAEYSRQQVAEAEQHYQSIEMQIAPLRTAGNELQQRLHGLQMNILKLNQAHERSVERAAQIEREMQEVADLLGCRAAPAARHRRTDGGTARADRRFLCASR